MTNRTPRESLAANLEMAAKLRDHVGAKEFDHCLVELAHNFMTGAPEKPALEDCVIIAGAIAFLRATLQAQDPNYVQPPDPSKPPDVIIGAVAITVDMKTKPPEGSVIGTCSQCGVKVHLPPSSQQIERMDDHARVLCMKDGGGCLDENIDKDKNPTFAMTPMALDELRGIMERRKL